ncbi:hypothetical protein VTI28DRAFT_3483 [Corynascus sepedonium]
MDDELLQAVRHNDLDEVKRLLEAGHDVNVKDDVYEQTAISWAAELDHLEVAKALYNKGANIRLTDSNGQNSVHWAAMRSERVLSFLLDSEREGQSHPSLAAQDISADCAKLDIDLSDNYGRTPLMVASRRGLYGNVGALLRTGADPLREDSDGRNVVFYAAQNAVETKKYGLVELILEKISNDPKVINGTPGGRPLAAAAMEGDVEMIRLLLKRKADPQVYDTNGRTPLYFAAWNGHIEAVGELINNGADPRNLSNPPNENVTAFALAATADEEEWKAYLDNSPDLSARENRTLGLHLAARHGLLKAVERMRFAGNGIDAQDDMGRTPLIWASIEGHVPIVKRLLELNADAKLSDTDYKETALMWAAEQGHAEIVELLSPKSDVNAQALGWRGFTALTFAVWNGHTACVEALIKAKADLKVVDEDGLSPLSCAARYDRVDAVKALIRAGADLYCESHGRKTPVFFARGNRDIVQAFIEEPRESTMGVEEEILPRVRAAELALRYACEDLYGSDETDSGSEDKSSSNDENGSEILGFILDQTKYLEAVDHNNRNLVSWAAQGGNSTEMAKLCTKKVNLELSDVDKRTPLHWAALSGNSRVAKCLLNNGVKPDSSDKEQRTPLSLAAEAGHLEVVKLLLSFRYGSVGAKVDDAAVGRKKVPERVNIKAGDTAEKDKLHNEDGNSAKLAGNEKGGVIVDIDSRDLSGQTPLWYAATMRHRATFAELLASGASPAIKDSKGRSIQNVLQETLNNEQESLSVQALEAMVKKLGSSEALWTGPRQEMIKTVDAGFQATVVSIHKGNQSDISLQTPTVDSLLDGHGFPELQGMKCAWIHLPANNVSLKGTTFGSGDNVANLNLPRCDGSRQV